MHFTSALAALIATLASCATQAQAKAVYAHFIVGNAASFTQADWAGDIKLAADAGIDGFALNIGTDPYTDTQLGYAYAAAAAHGNFKMFISFDYAAASFSASAATTTINKYKTLPAQAMYNSKAIVSTFEGPGQAQDWAGIKLSTGCFFIPDWTSAKGSPGTFANADGGLSWDVWPTTANDMTDGVDKAWRTVLGSKAYMMGVAPWFFTNLPQYKKNWLWRGNQLWYERWQQVLQIEPELVEILTWNDFGESHYIGPVHTGEFPQGAWYANNPHDGWRALLPAYIAAYKSGNATVTPKTDTLSWAHQPNPGKSCGSGGTTGGQAGGDPTVFAEDAIDVDVLLTGPADIAVQIGSGAPTTKKAVSAGISHFQIPFNGQTGQVTYTVSRNSKTVMTVKGASITTTCQNGQVNWNAITGSQSSDASSSGSSNAAPAPAPSSSAPPAPAPAASSAAPAAPSATAAAAAAPPASSSAAPAPSASSSAAPAPAPAPSAPSSGSAGTTCTVSFAVQDVTAYGETIFVAGGTDSLGQFDTTKGVKLDAASYTASDPLWQGKAAGIPAGKPLMYRYYKTGTDGSVHWEQGLNRKLDVPADCGGAGGVKANDKA